MYMKVKLAGGLAAALLAMGSAQAQVGTPSDDDFQAAPPQFRSELTGGRMKPKDEELNRPLVNAKPPTADPRDFNGIYSSLRRPGPAGGAPRPGAGPGGPGGPGGPPGAGPALLGGPAQAARAAGGGTQRNVGGRACVYRSFPGLGSYTTTILLNDWTAMFLMEENHTLRWARFTDKHDPSFKPNYSGDSIARWDGNTLVIDTTNVRQENSDALKHYSERFTKQANGDITFERFDVAAEGPATPLDKGGFRWRPDLTYVEDVCEDFGEAFGVEYK